MSLTKFTGDTNNIQSLADQPLLTPSQLKAKFDKTGDDLKTYINNTLTSEIDTALRAKANSSDVYDKWETDSLLWEKADKSNVYQKTEIDNKLADSGWQNLSLSATGFTNGSTISYRKIGKLVQIYIFITRGNTDFTSAYATKLATIPEGYRHSYETKVIGVTDVYKKKFIIHTGADGYLGITLLDDKIPANDMIRGINLVYMTN